MKYIKTISEFMNESKSNDETFEFKGDDVQFLKKRIDELGLPQYLNVIDDDHCVLTVPSSIFKSKDVRKLVKLLGEVYGSEDDE